jgi:signal transduction histidine kinase
LQTVSNALSQALTPHEVAAAVITQGVNSLKAHAGTVVLLNESGTELEIVGTLGFPQDVTKQWQRFSVNTPVALADAVRRNSPVFIESFAEWKDRYPDLELMTGITGSQALVAFPLIVEGRTIGAMGLSFPEPREFSADDRAFMLALTQQCAQSLDRARLYETEQRLRAEAEDANRIKDEFLATVSHELRTPLTAIVGWSSMLRTNNFDQAATARGLETIERNAKAQTRIVEDLLDVSRIITGKLRLDARPIELNSIIRIALDALSTLAANKEIKIRTQLDTEVGPIWGDPARLQQVFWNLFSNAVKFTPDGGEVEISLRSLPSHAELSVRDTGEGISPEFLPFVFERFRQADSTMTRAHGGLGLGLAIVRHLVEMHGGTVRAESDGVGQGSTFTLELPLIVGHSASTDANRQQPATVATPLATSAVQLAYPPNLTHLRILLVDDEPDARALLTTILEQCGASVRAVASATEALAALPGFKPDLLVSDIGMPDEDGYSLIRRVRALGPEQGGETPAIALTAYAGEEDRLRALLAGYQIHVTKPINPSELVMVVASIAGIGESK